MSSITPMFAGRSPGETPGRHPVLTPAMPAQHRCRRREGLRLLTMVLACMIGTPVANAQKPIAIPLTLTSDRLVIYVGVNGGQPFPYMFDTGSQIFEVSQMVLAGTTVSGTLATGVVQQYEQDGFLYDVVTAPSVQFYASGSDATPLLSLNATGGGYRMGSITGIYSGTAYSGTSTPVTGTTVVGNFAGIFGAGAYASLVSGSIAMGSVLGQSTTTGWVVSANGPFPAVTLGLDAAIRDSFASGTNAAVYDWMSGTTAFPVSGAASSMQNPVILNLAWQSGTSAVSWSTSAVFDTGTPGNHLRPGEATFAALQEANAIATNYSSQSGTTTFLSAGASLAVTGTTGGFSYAPTLEAYALTPPASIPPPYSFVVSSSGTGVPTSTLGIGFFETNSVMYDLENGRIGVTTAVVVPEPSAYAMALAGLACGGYFVWRRRIVRGT